MEPGERVCPKCGASMAQIRYGEVVVDRCSDCQGLWFDWNENVRLRGDPAAATLDAGNPHVGIMLDAIEGALCPVCHVRMDVLGVPEYTHVRFDCCPRCFGVFFDAGEFREYQRATLVEWLGALVSRLGHGPGSEGGQWRSQFIR
jgi:Zn-finger nucleic acid-binding protein